MERRVFLAAAGAAALSGCASVDSEDEVYHTDEIETPASTPQEVPLAEQGFPGTICEEEPNLDLIDAIDDPACARDWSDVEVADRYRRIGGLADDSVVIGLTNSEGARAYPLEVLRIHEVVNDHFGSPVLVSYCPLCRSGMVARRIVDEVPTRSASPDSCGSPRACEQPRASRNNGCSGSTLAVPKPTSVIAGTSSSSTR